MVDIAEFAYQINSVADMFEGLICQRYTRRNDNNLSDQESEHLRFCPCIYFDLKEESEPCISIEITPYIEHSTRGHIVVSRDCIEVVRGSERRDQCHRSNHDKWCNRTDREHARILWRDIGRTSGTEAVRRCEYMRQDKLSFELARKYRARRW